MRKWIRSKEMPNRYLHITLFDNIVVCVVSILQLFPNQMKKHIKESRLFAGLIAECSVTVRM